MLKSSNLSSRSTFFSSNSFKNTSRKRKAKKKVIERIPLTENQILAKKLIKDIIEHSIQIADFHLKHKKNQKTYENRQVKNELNFINKDELFIGSLPDINKDEFNWYFISKLIGKIIYVESTPNLLRIFNFNTESDNPISFDLTNENKKIISAELYEHESSIKCLLLLLYNDFTFIIYDLFLINQDGMNNKDKLIKTEFDFKPYLNIPNIDEYIPDYKNGIKLLIFPKILNNYGTDLIINFTQIAGKFLIFNILSKTVIGNYVINQKDYVTKESEYLDNLRKLINAFFSKVWSIKQYECLVQIINSICDENNSSSIVYNELQKLAVLLNMASNDEDDNLSLLLKTKQFTFTDIKNTKTLKERDISAEKLYSNILLPILTKSLTGYCIITLKTLLTKIKIFFEKLYGCSIAVGKSDLSLIEGKFKVYQNLFLKCYNRGINLKQLFLKKDLNDYGYVDRKVVYEIFKDLPIGLTLEEIDELLNSYNIFDENDKYMYEYLFLLDEQIITKIVFSTPLNLLDGNKFTCGYFINNKPVNDIEFDNIKGKLSAPTNKTRDGAISLDTEYEHEKLYGNKIIEKGYLTLPEKKFDYEYLIDYIINTCLTIEISDMVILSSLNLVVIITPYNQNIPIFKLETKYSCRPKILEKIGIINLNSYYNNYPGFLYCIEERNLLITQRTTSSSTELVFIDIGKDLLFPSRENKQIEYSVSDDDNNCKIVKDIITFDQGRKNMKLIKKILYLQKSEILAVSTDEEICIINPRSHHIEISLKMQEIKRTAYTNICRQFCENPDEQTGDNYFKLLKKISLDNILKDFYTFSLGNNLLCDENYYKYSNTDWLFLLFDDGVIGSYCINKIFLTQKAKEIDTPIPDTEKMKLFHFAVKNKQNSLNKYKEELNQNENNYNANKIENENKINQVSLNIKETMIYEKEFELNKDVIDINNIHQLISLLKYLELKYSTNQIFEMFPFITFSKIKYETDADYFKTDLFPTDKNYQELGTDIENINLPKNKNNLKTDLSLLNSHLTILDSAIKKLAKFILEKKIPNDYIYKSSIDNNEELLEYDQYIAGFTKLGLCNRPYLNNEELKVLFEAIDENQSNILTLEEYNKFLEKIDIYSIKTDIENEKQKKIKERIFDFDIENFANSSEEEKKQLLNPILDKVKNFYMNIPEVTYNDIKENMDLIIKKISAEDIKNRFNYGFIFYEDFQDLIYEFVPKIKEEEINKLFAYFDQNNMNLFIYVRDFIKYFKNNNIANTPNKSIEETGQIKKYMTEEQFLLIWIGIMKKILKLCILDLGFFPDNFSEKFIFIKQYNKHLILLNYIPTEIAIEKIKKVITNLLPLEEKILYEYYMDYNNFGILYFDSFKEILDNMMKYINDSDIYDLTKFDTFDPDNANKYINIRKYNTNKNEKKLEKNYIENLLPIYDKVLMKFAYYTQNKSGMKNLTFFYNYLRQYGEEKEYLTQKEFMKLLKELIPKKQFNTKFAKNLISQLSENVKLINEPVRPVISISRIILFIINTVKKVQLMENIINSQELDFIRSKTILDGCNKSICHLSQYYSLMKEINKLSEDYLKMIQDCHFSGLIILNKQITLRHIMNRLNDIDLDILDYSNYYMNRGNDILVNNFNTFLKGKLNPDTEEYIYNQSLPGNFLSQIQIPTIKINVIDNNKEMKNLKKYQSGMIENFDFFQPELQCIVNVTKINKSFLLKQISKDGTNLLNYILDSLKLNHYLQKIYLSKNITKSFDNFLFLRNFGIYTKERFNDKTKIMEEDLYIVNEKIDSNEYVPLSTLANRNGGLLFIPEIANTGMGIFILRSWGKFILNIINELNKLNRCFKYFTVKDFYGTFNGKKLKMANIYGYSIYNEEGEMTFGPDMLKILMLLDKLPTGNKEELTFDDLDNTYCNDAYISPEMIKKIKGDRPTYKNDSWLYGILMFNLIFGITPESFYSQLKKFCEIFYGNYSMEQIINDDDFDVLKSNFFYNPFNNINVIMQDKFYFTKILKENSFSAIIKSKYINDKDPNTYNISTFLDLINACLNLDPEKRPSICHLLNFDLFEIPLDLKERFGKVLSNVMDYYSPDNVIKDKIVLPLRKICCEIIRNQETKPFVINNYQNFILNVIKQLNMYMFKIGEPQIENLDDKQSVSSTNNSCENNDNDIYMDDNPEYKMKNSVLVKYVVEYKVVDLLIFLVLRHFNTNLKFFKKKIKYGTDEEEKNSSSITNPYPTFTDFETLLATTNPVLNTNATFNDRNTNKKYYEELNEYCGKLISALVEFLYQCVQALNAYDNILSLYVENVLIWIIKLFIGEENQLLGSIHDYKESNDKIKQYLLNRTFMRDENIVIKDDFQEDDLDQIFSVFNLNKQLIDIKSYWSPELYYFTNGLFRNAFGENCSGNYNHAVIKNYFLFINSTMENKNKVNPLSNIADTIKKIKIPGTNLEIDIKNDFLTTEYVSEVFTIVDLLKKLSNKSSNQKKNIETKRNALNYINIVLKSKNSSKIRGCLDCKIHLVIQKYLFTSINDMGIKKDLFNILKEISLSLIDMNEISWQFGNNYEKIYEKKSNVNSIGVDLENNSCVNDSNWDSNSSLIDFTSNILTQSHIYMLNYSNKFLKINIQKTFTTYKAHMKEFGFIFSSPLILKPIMRCLQNRNENYHIRQTCLEILFNILLSNEIKITSNLNMTMCNFYEMLVDIISYNPINKDISYNYRIGDEYDTGTREKYFIDSVSKVIKIIIEMQNPDIKRQIFNCPMFLKYMEKNKLSFVPRLDIFEIEEEFNKIKDLLNFENLEGKIIFLIDTFKVWVYENKLNIINENMHRIKNIMGAIHHIFNNEWNNGLKTAKKNCLIFNIVKLFEWIIVYDHREFLFPKNSESFTSTIIISFMSKIKNNSEIMKGITLELNKMIHLSDTVKNKNDYGINIFANTGYNLNKMYNYISLKLLNIIYSIFYLGDNYYNAIFNKMKIGLLISELFTNQLETLSLFLNFDNIDISILNNYMAEVKIRLGFIESILSLPKIFDDIKMQFLQSEFINYIFKYMLDDIRYFKTNSNKLTLEFMKYKNSFPLRNEAMAFLDIVFKKFYNIQKRTDTDCFIFDEIIRNVKVFHLVQNQLSIIRTKIKGNEVLSVLGFFNMVLKNNEREIIKIMNSENAKDYFVYALQKETYLKKMFPLIVEYINKVQAGIEK